MKSQTFKDRFIRLVIVLHIALFAYAATSKLVDFENFLIELGQSPLLSAFARFVAIAVPSAELLICLLLLVPRWQLTGLYASYALMSMFTAYIFIILNYGSFIPCSCGGILSELGWTEHLFFNIAFVVLALLAIVLHSRQGAAKGSKALPPGLFLKLAVAFLACTALVIVLYLLSEHQIHRNNGFVRRYPHHPVNKLKAVDIRYNSYYVAGIANGSIYLGNTSAPLHMLVADTALANVRPVKLKVAGGAGARVSAVQLRVRPPYFYLADGSVPLLYRGRVGKWLATPYLNDLARFSQFEPASGGRFVIRSLDSKRNTHVIGGIGVSRSPRQAPWLIRSQGNTVFDTDGILLYNQQLKQSVYVYLYRNQFLTADDDLRLLKRARTIDTVQKAVIKIASQDSGRIRKLAEQPAVINKKACTSGRYLFIQSDRLGKYEPEEMLGDASIIDVYDLVKQTYEFSFYLYRHNGEEVRKFAVHGNLLIGLTQHYMVTYRLEKEHFNFTTQ